MTESICVYGLWHLGSVTAACLAAEGLDVVGLDPNAEIVAGLQSGRPPILERDLAELIEAGSRAGHLTFTLDPRAALQDATVLWVTFDTPVDDEDQADHDWVAEQIHSLRAYVRPGTLVIVSSQVPVGFTRRLERAWRAQEPKLHLTFVSVPENLRLGQAIERFRHPERIVVGLGQGVSRERVAGLLGRFTDRIEWMSLESAEMTKHALNGFLALTAVYANELARIAEHIGADALEVERGLRSDVRVGKYVYVAPGSPIAGGTLARDVALLQSLARRSGLESPLVSAIPISNGLHRRWAIDVVTELLAGVDAPRVALLGLTYKPGTDTLRRSFGVEMASWLLDRGVEVRAYDPALVGRTPPVTGLVLADGAEAALAQADLAVLLTSWPDFRDITVDMVLDLMRTPRIVDQAGFLTQLAHDERVAYVRVGQPRRGSQQ